MSVILDPVELRHTLHKFPELMFEEFKTTETLIKNIEGMNDIKILRPLETGLIAEYKVNDGNYYLFRADIDALPIKEETGVSFSSQNNLMHACGHDVHTSILYGLLQHVVINRINKNILFLFQPGEEGGGGPATGQEPGRPQRRGHPLLGDVGAGGGRHQRGERQDHLRRLAPRMAGETE